PYDILLINGTPNDVPLCQGIITTDFQPPLSHINILSYNRGTPIMALKSAWDNEILNELDGKLVYYEVRTDSFSVEKAKTKNAEKFWNKNTPSKTITLQPDFSQIDLISIEDLDVKDADMVGAKAANFGELDKIEGVVVPEAAFAIPFYWYKKHVEDNTIDTLITDLLTDEIFTTNVDTLKKQLKSVRNAIKDAPINDTLLQIVSDKIRENECYTRMRFRSSTNAEDAKGFNGAGLYDSETGYLYNEDKSVEEAIKKVWASLWNLRAFQERSYFKINNENVAMGILVHRSFPNEAVNGVVVTKNIYRPESSGHIVNLQKEEVSIVNPPFGITSELFVLQQRNSTDPSTAYADYISYSSANNNESLLSQEELIVLNETLLAIKTHFYRKWKAQWKMNLTEFGVDIELKYDGENRQLYIKQARPY
ncbi:MAG: PEP/pyruvate-binding domain-containing protein, partial [Chitinophagales bacterium]